MGNIKTCSNGHNYDSSLYSTCPYCPKGNTGERTIVNNQAQEFKTEVNIAGSANKTRVVLPNLSQNETKTIPMQGISPSNYTSVPNGTKIIVPGETIDIQTRKLVGFLVSYDLNPQGKSFKLYEGKNYVGADSHCDIVISSDPGVSGKHMTILYRNGKFRFKDEFSTNGSFVNNEMQEDGYLENYDVIRVGRTKFVFMAVPFDHLK